MAFKFRIFEDWEHSVTLNPCLSGPRIGVANYSLLEFVYCLGNGYAVVGSPLCIVSLLPQACFEGFCAPFLFGAF